MSRRGTRHRPAPGRSGSRPTGRGRSAVAGAKVGGSAAPAASGGIRQFLEMAEREVVTATFWSAAPPEDGAAAVVRIRGRRLHLTGRPNARDQFVREETVGPLPPGIGPFSITTIVSDVNPGEWVVTADVAPDTRSAGGWGRAQRPRQPLAPAGWSWRRWSLWTAPEASVSTTMKPLARRPGILRGGWAAMVALGIVFALALQTALVAREQLPTGSSLTLSAVAVVLGAIGAKAWYVILDRRQGRWNGWCIQGLVLGIVTVLMLGAPALDLPLGTFLDLTTPALFLGMATGRVGCFVGGCCYGRPTCSRWGIWSSDQRIGVRRIPTQLLESALSLAVAIVTFLLALTSPAPGGLVFAGALAAYTLCRQALLRLRAEARRTSSGSRATTVAAAVVLLGVAVMALA